MAKTRPQVDDEDIDRFVARFLSKLNPALTPEERADTIHDFVLGYMELTEPEPPRVGRRSSPGRCGHALSG